MIRLKLAGAMLVLSAIYLAPASAQVSEPAAEAARDPGFSVYSGFGAPNAMAQASPEDVRGSRMAVRPYRAHHAMRHR